MRSEHVGPLPDLRVNDAALRVNRVDERGGRDVEGGMTARNAIGDQRSVSDARDLVTRTLLDGDVRAARGS